VRRPESAANLIDPPGARQGSPPDCAPPHPRLSTGTSGRRRAL